VLGGSCNKKKEKEEKEGETYRFIHSLYTYMMRRKLLSSPLLSCIALLSKHDWVFFSL